MSANPWDGWQAFSDAARSYIDSLSKASPQAQGAAAQFSDLLREQFATYSQPLAAQPWNPQAWPGAFAAPTPAPAPSAAPSELPAFGATREHQERAQRMAQAAQRMDAAQRRLQRLWSDVLREASTRFVSQLQATQPGAATPASLRKLYDTWIDCAENAYARVAHSEAFCQAQAEFANAASQWRLEQQGNIEQWSKFLDLPTRSEINSLTRRLRALEQQLRSKPDSRAAPAAPSPARRSAPSKRAKAKKKRV
jgi:polyhydroxyalkanoate synthesis regulator phasin